MSKRLAVNDSIAFAFGFTWQALDPVESRSAKLSLLFGQGNKWQASFKRGRVEYLGVTKDDLSPIPHIKTVSGAALMASHPELAGRTVWIVMEEPADEQFGEGMAIERPGRGTQNDIVVVGLVNGNIVVDDFVDRAGYNRHRAAFAERCTKAKLAYTTVGTSYSLGGVSQSYVWDDFLPAKASKAMPVRPLEPGLQGRVLLGLTLFALAFGLVWAYVAWDNEQKQLAERQRRSREARNLPALYTAAVEELLGRPVLRANTVFAELRGKLGDLPSSVERWALKSIQCKAETAACVAVWENRFGLGTNRGFAAAAPKEWGEIAFDPSGRTVSHALPFKLTTARLPERTAWLTSREFMLKPYSEWQSYWVVGFHPEIAAQPHVVGRVTGLDDGTAADLPNVTRAIAWSIKATPWDLSDGFDTDPGKADSSLPDSVTVERIELRMDAEQHLKFDAEGDIYVR